MPVMDSGETDGPPGPSLDAVWVTLSVPEAFELLQSLQVWAEEVDEGVDTSSWHTHITDSEGRELTIAVGDTSTAVPTSSDPT